LPGVPFLTLTHIGSRGPSDPDPCEWIQSEVQRAIQHSIKGVEYFSTSGPTLGSTPKDILHVRGTMNLYHYHPLADEVYRVPVLIVMATTNWGYILDMVPGQSFIEFLSKRRRGLIRMRRLR
jgi:polyhydroxyalkanoate synthase